jgi:phage terminase small subunit
MSDDLNKDIPEARGEGEHAVERQSGPLPVLSGDNGLSPPVEYKLTDMQQKFVDEYLIDLNGKQAAIRAGYSPIGADSYASQLLSFPNVRDAVTRQSADLSARASVSAQKMLAWLKYVQDADYTDAFTVNFELKSKDQIPKELRTLIQGITVIKKSTQFGEDTHCKVTFVDKLRSAEIISKYLGMFDVRESSAGFTLVVNQANIVNNLEPSKQSVSLGQFALDVPIDILPENTSG